MGKFENLKNKMEPVRAVEKIPEPLTKPLVQNIEFSEHGGGEIKIEKNGLQLVIDYGEEEEASSNFSMLQSERDCKNFINRFNNWKVIRTLTIRGSDNKDILSVSFSFKDGEEKELSDVKSGSENITVFFPATNDVPSQESFGAGALRTETTDGKKENIILLTTNIASPVTIIGLFHEIGHHIRPGVNKEIQIDITRYLRYLETNNKNLLTPEERDDINLDEKMFHAILGEERDAWAYALRQLKPLIRADFFSKDLVIDLIHKGALQWNTNFFRKISDSSIKDKILRKIIGFINTSINTFKKELDKRDEE